MAIPPGAAGFAHHMKKQGATSPPVASGGRYKVVSAPPPPAPPPPAPPPAVRTAATPSPYEHATFSRATDAEKTASAIAAVTYDRRNFACLLETQREDPAFICKLVAHMAAQSVPDPIAIGSLSPALQRNVTVVTAFVTHARLSLKDLPDWQGNLQVVLAAVGRDFRELMHAKEAMKDNIEVFRAAAAQISALTCSSYHQGESADSLLKKLFLAISPRLRNEIEVVRFMVRERGFDLFFQLNSARQEEMEIVKKVFVHHRCSSEDTEYLEAFKRLSINVRGNKMWTLDLLNTPTMRRAYREKIYNLLSPSLQTDPEILKASVQRHHCHGSCIDYTIFCCILNPCEGSLYDIVCCCPCNVVSDRITISKRRKAAEAAVPPLEQQMM